MQTSRHLEMTYPLHPLRGGDLVENYVTDSATYTVPAGKIFVVQQILFATTNLLTLDGTAIRGNYGGGTFHMQTADPARVFWDGEHLGSISGANGTPTDTTPATNEATVVNAPWLFTVAAGGVLASNTGNAVALFGYLLPANRAA